MSLFDVCQPSAMLHQTRTSSFMNLRSWCTAMMTMILRPPGLDCNHKGHGRMTITCKHCYFRCPWL